MITLAGKRILVTGGSRGIGRATALMAASSSGPSMSLVTYPAAPASSAARA